MFCLVNGHLQQTKDAVLSINDLAIMRGYGIFDFFRLSDGVPLFIDDHLDRFYHASERVRLKIPFTKNELKEHLYTLFDKNQMRVAGIRMILTGGYTPNGYDPGQPNLVITQEPITFPPAYKYENGIKLITHEYLRDLPEVKTINYMTGIFLQDKVQREGAYDVVYYYNDQVLELTRSNIFIVDEHNKIITPKNNILLGITRKNLLRAAKDKVSIIERPIALKELYNAKEAFLTGTTKRVLPITQMDDRTIGNGKPGNVTRQMIELFEQYEREYVSSYSRE
ncbi:MAG: aminotransferase class IV [Fulvivirga sp.]